MDPMAHSLFLLGCLILTVMFCPVSVSFSPALSDFFLLNNSGENYVYIYIYISFSFQMIFACLDSNLFFPVPNV